jgi:hypothetical protein
MSGMDEVFGLFPTPFLRAPGTLDARLVDSLVRHFSALALKANKASDNLSHTEVLRPGDSPLFVEAAALITPKIVDMGALMFGERLDWAIKEMWVNVLDTGGLQAMHNHANSFISGVVYLTPTHPGFTNRVHEVVRRHRISVQARARQHHADAVQCRQMGEPGAGAGRPGAVSELCAAHRAAQPGRAPHHAVVQRHPRRTGLVGLRGQVQRLKRLELRKRKSASCRR